LKLLTSFPFGYGLFPFIPATNLPQGIFPVDRRANGAELTWTIASIRRRRLSTSATTPHGRPVTVDQMT